MSKLAGNPGDRLPASHSNQNNKANHMGFLHSSRMIGDASRAARHKAIAGRPLLLFVRG